MSGLSYFGSVVIFSQWMRKDDSNFLVLGLFPYEVTCQETLWDVLPLTESMSSLNWLPPRKCASVLALTLTSVASPCILGSSESFPARICSYVNSWGFIIVLFILHDTISHKPGWMQRHEWQEEHLSGKHEKVCSIDRNSTFCCCCETWHT